MAKPQYRSKHQAERKKWKRLVDAGDASCCLCGQWLPPGAAFDLDHEPGTLTYRGVAHAHCNRSDGAKRGNRDRAQGSHPTPRRSWIV